MSQDSPATDAGTVSRTDALRSAFVRGLDKCREIKETYGTWPSLPGRVELAGDEFPDDAGTPDTWAPVNRRTMRDDVDRFRNERMPVPKKMPDALTLASLALEYYEHAAEVSTRTTNAFASLDLQTDAIRERCIDAIMANESADPAKADTFNGGRFSKSRTGAKELTDLSPAMVAHLEERAQLAAKKAEAEKEMGVARRRHATALSYLNAFLSPFQLNRVIPDVTAGDTDRGSLSEGV